MGTMFLKPMPAEVRESDRKKILAALEGAARLTRSDVSNLFGRHRSQEQLDALAAALEIEGQIMRVIIPPSNGHDRRVEVWEKAISQSARSAVEQAPPGEGWLPKAKVLRKAQRGVVPAVAARAGRLTRKADAARKGIEKTGTPRVSDQQRGATRLISLAFRSYKDQGIIEVQGDWIRLAKNPTRRPPHHWYEALLHFLAEAHPTLDGKWRRQPKKTLVGVMEHALGRKLEPHERVRRFPGFAGSWHPQHILLYDSDQETIMTLAEIQERTGP